MTFKPYNPSSLTDKSQRKLPHWGQLGCTYFVTFRLNDSIPKPKLDVWNQKRMLWLESRGVAPDITSSSISDQLDEEQRREYYERFIHAYHKLLDNGWGSCLLRKSSHSKIVTNALMHFDHDRYHMSDFIVMPNHVHLLVCPMEGWLLPQLLQSWKRYTAREINKKNHRSGALWQPESYDHIVRNEAQLTRIQKYIKDNPKGLKPSEYHYYQAK